VTSGLRDQSTDDQGIAPKGEWDLPVDEAVRKFPHTRTESVADEQMMLPERDSTMATSTLSSKLPPKTGSM
jgi:hypothetical protein